MNLQQNMNILENNKNSNDQKVIELKNQTDKQIKELSQQVKNLSNIKFQLENENKLKEEKVLNLALEPITPGYIIDFFNNSFI